MNRRPLPGKVRALPSVHGRHRVGQAGMFSKVKDGHFVKRDSHTGRCHALHRSRGVTIFVGPSVEGVDVEYIERVSGKVSNRKPSFAR